MCNQMEHFRTLAKQALPGCKISIDEPARAGGTYWLDLYSAKRHYTLEYRPGKGFGLFHRDVGFGQGPAEIYRTAERAVQRVAQLMRPGSGTRVGLGLKQLRQLYGHSQVNLAKKGGVKQPAISRFEKRGDVKLSTLAASIKALGGHLEIRAHFSDADVPISLTPD